LSRDDPDLLVARAMVQLEAGEYSEALAHTNVNSPKMRMIRGDVYARVGAYAHAEQEYLQSEKSQNEIDLSLSRIYASVGRFTLAATMAEQILHQEPFNKAAWSQLVEAKIKAKRHEEAIVLLKAGILENKTAEVFAQFLHALLGRVYLSQEQSAAALQEFQLARLDEGNNITEPDIAYDYYRALLSIRPSQAADHLAMALKTPHIVNSIARIAIGHHDIALAQQIILDTARQYPNNLILTLTLGDILAAQDSPYADAVAAYRQALQMSPTNIKAQVGLATYHWNMKSFEDSDRHFHHVLKNLPDHRKAARNHARMVNQWKGKEASLFAYEQLLSRMSRTLAHQLFLEDPLLLKSRNAPSTLSDLETLSATLERNAIQLSDWRPDNASYALEQLKDLEPPDHYVSFLLADQYQRIGETRNAIAAYESLLSREPANIDAFTALKHARLTLRPQIDGKAEYFEQAGREGLSEITSFTFGAQTVLPIADEEEFVSFGYHHQIFMSKSSEQTTGDALLLSGRSEVADRLFLFADMEVAQFSTGFSTRPTFQAGLDYGYLDGLNLGLEFFLHNVAENTETIQQDIYRYGLQAHSKWVPAPNWALNGSYRFQQYSDTNLSHAFEILNVIDLMEAPRQLQLTAAYHFDTYSEETIRNPLLATLQGTVHPYFSPQIFGYVNVGAVWRHWLKSMQYGHEQLYYELRYGLQWDSENEFYNIFGGGVHWDICHYATVGVESNFLRSGTYDSATVVTYLTLWFP
ncbi:MAG: tetratricopeptide repeat protein, partial [Fuerstiella sp.]